MPAVAGGVGLVLLIAAIATVAVKNLPALLEILLLQYTEMSAGSRYTITTLSNYAIITTGAVSEKARSLEY